MAAPLHGQISLSSTPQALSATPIVSTTFVIKAAAANNGIVAIGKSDVSSTTGFQLLPGESIIYEPDDQSGHQRFVLRVSDFYVVGTSGDTVSWFGSPAN